MKQITNSELYHDNNSHSLLDICSGIIENKGYCLDFQQHNRGRNFNNICKNIFLNSVDYKKRSKLYIMNYIEDKFKGYLNSLCIDKNGIVLQDLDKKFLIRYNTKFSKHYADKVVRRMKYLCINNANTNCVMVTLTVDPKKYNSFVDIWLDVKNQQHRFLTRVKQILKSYGINNVKYLSSIECHHNSSSWMNPHIHIVFFGLKRLMDWRKLRDIWNLGHVWINRSKDNKKISKPIDYITKYITKTYNDTDKLNIRDQAIKWFFNIRSFSYSNGLIYPLNYSINNYNWLCYIYCDSPHILNWFNDNIENFFSKYNYISG